MYGDGVVRVDRHGAKFDIVTIASNDHTHRSRPGVDLDDNPAVEDCADDDDDAGDLELEDILTLVGGVW